MELPPNIVPVTHALNGRTYFLDIDLVVAYGPGDHGTMVVSCAGPVMPIKETEEFLTNQKSRRTDGKRP